MDEASKGMLRQRRLWAWCIAILASIVVLLGTALLALWRHPIRLRNQQDLIEKPLSQLLGFEVSVDAPVVVRLSMRPRVDLKGVHVRQATADTKVEAFRAKEINVRVELLPLLKHKWSIRRLEITDAELCVSAKRDSPCDWRRALNAVDQITALDAVTVRRLKVSCHGGACGKEWQRNFELIMANLPTHGTTKVSIRTAGADDPPVAELSGGTWSEFRANRPWRTQFDVRWNHVRVEAKGTIREPRELRGVDLNVDGRTQLGSWHGVALGEPRIRGHVVDEEGGYRFQMKDSKWGTATITGEVKAQRTDEGLKISGTTAVRRMNLDPWMDAPAEGQAEGGYADAAATFTTAGDTIDEWLEHLSGSARIDAGPAELPIDQVERWSKGFLKVVFSLPAEGKAAHVRCIGGHFDLRDARAVTNDLRIDTETTRMRGIGSLSLRTGELDLVIKPTLKHGPLKDAPLVQVSGVIERPVTSLASDEARKASKPTLERLSDQPADRQEPCGKELGDARTQADTGDLH